MSGRFERLSRTATFLCGFFFGRQFSQGFRAFFVSFRPRNVGSIRALVARCHVSSVVSSLEEHFLGEICQKWFRAAGHEARQKAASASSARDRRRSLGSPGKTENDPSRYLDASDGGAESTTEVSFKQRRHGGTPEQSRNGQRPPILWLFRLVLFSFFCSAFATEIALEPPRRAANQEERKEKSTRGKRGGFQRR